LTVPVAPSLAGEDAVIKDVNVIENIQSGTAGVEVQLKSARAFPVRALPPVLRVGPQAFNRSFRPEDGDLQRLIFLISPKEFAQLRAGEPMYVIYGRGESPEERWDYGAFPNEWADW
jgi:hypothetical protein